MLRVVAAAVVGGTLAWTFRSGFISRLVTVRSVEAGIVLSGVGNVVVAGLALFVLATAFTTWPYADGHEPLSMPLGLLLGVALTLPGRLWRAALVGGLTHVGLPLVAAVIAALVISVPAHGYAFNGRDLALAVLPSAVGTSVAFLLGGFWMAAAVHVVADAEILVPPART